MRNAILIAVIFMMVSILLVPPMFREGGLFDITKTHILSDGSKFVEHGIYFDDVFNAIFLLSMCFIGFSIPVLKPNLGKIWRWMSSICGAWFLAGIIYMILKTCLSEEYFKGMKSDWLYIKAVIIFTIGLTAIAIQTAWTEQKK